MVNVIRGWPPTVLGRHLLCSISLQQDSARYVLESYRPITLLPCVVLMMSNGCLLDRSFSCWRLRIYSNQGIFRRMLALTATECILILTYDAWRKPSATCTFMAKIRVQCNFHTIIIFTIRMMTWHRILLANSWLSSHTHFLPNGLQ